MKRILILFLTMWMASDVFASTQHLRNFIQPTITQPEAAPTDYVFPLVEGTTLQIQKDWVADKGDLNRPDRSYKSIWVRMFPILSLPFRDPYPITQNKNRIYLGNSRKLRVKTLTGEFIAEGKRLEFFFNENKYTVDGQAYPLQKLWIVPLNRLITTTMKWDEAGVELRGEFVVQPTYFRETRDRKWSMINVATMAEYLYAVIPSEMPLSWPDEALKTQAVAARTYAMYQMAVARGQAMDHLGHVKPRRDWDVDPTTWFQSYRGAVFLKNGRWETVEWPIGRWAVDQTLGDVIVHRGEIIKSFFSANAGGKTCTPKECFGWEPQFENPSYLQPVNDAPGIRDVGGGTWGKDSNITPRSIAGKLKGVGLDLNVKRLIQRDISSTGRTWSLIVETDRGEVRLNRRQTKRVISLFGRFRSHMFKLFPMKNGRHEVIGHGFGHGVGFSQWGAKLFAEQGRSYIDILTHYYTDVEVQRLGQAPVLASDFL